MDLAKRVQQLPSYLIHYIRTFLPPHPPRKKYRDNGVRKQLTMLLRSSKLTPMALYQIEDIEGV